MASSTMHSLLKLLFILLSLLISNSSSATQPSKHYVVYMGGSDGMRDEEGGAEAAELAHLTLLSSIIPSEESERLSLIHSYNYAFKGFSALLTESEASLLSDHDEVVSVFPDPTLQLTTTRSWDFLDAQSGVGSHQMYGPDASAQDVIIGVIDTGVWPESPSFSDEGLGEIPSRWKGVCMEGHDFNKSNCNRKLIGARYYNVIDDSSELKSKRSDKTTPRKGTGSPRDAIGHGTHTASTAVGAPVANASYFGLAKGTARGGSPSSRLATYKACTEEGCSGANVLKAIEDAIRDGVNIISISISMSSIFQSDFFSDPIAIGAFHANQKGVMVVCSAGNEGPDPSTVVNSAPWIFTVAASTIDRAFSSSVVLGNGHILHGTGINFSNLTRSKLYPLAFGRDVASASVPLSEARNCYPGSLDVKKAAGKIIVCINTDPTVSRRIKKLVAESARAVGMLLIDEASKDVALDTGAFPFSQLGDMEGMQILKFINTTKNPMATILPTVDLKRFKPAPVVAYFSSRGPGQLTETILKPDVIAPGVGILAAMVPKGEGISIPFGKKPSDFAIRSGTSMACPHVAGIVAVLKSIHRNWSPSMIKSALMTTATMANNLGKPFTNSTDNPATPLEVGAGEVSPLRAINPGLVYETTTQDYLYFLCYYGYKPKVIRSVAGPNFTCPKNSSEDLISDINYPSISIKSLQAHRSVRTIRRTVTNVGTANATYTANVNSPAGLEVKMRPQKLAFDEKTPKASFEVSFSSNGAAKGYNFGSLTWSHGLHSVQTVFAVNIV